MDPITILTFIIGALVAAIPIAYNYSKKLALALAYIQMVLNVINKILQGNLDHVWTDAECAEVGKAVVPIALKINDDLGVNAEIKS